MKRYALIVASALVGTSLHATLIVQGNNTEAPRGFTSPVATKVLHKQTGTFFVGLDSSSTETGAWALSKAVRPLPSPTRARFEPIGGNNTTIPLSNRTINHLAIAAPADKPATLAFVASEATKKITAATTDGRTVKQTAEDLNLDTGSAANGINNVAADDLTGSESYIYAALADATNTRSLALVAIEKNTDGTLKALQTKDAQTGTAGNLGVELTGDITQVKGDDGGNQADLLTGSEANKVALHWDSTLQRLYIGLRITTDAAVSNATIGKAVVVAHQVCGKIERRTIADDNALTSPLAPIPPPSGDEIIVSRGVAGATLRATHLGVMHTSTGPSYLIVCGGTADDNTGIGVSNAVYALPLVDKPESSHHGTLADKNSQLENYKFVTEARIPGELADTTDTFSRVGGGGLATPAPIDTHTLPISTTDEVADMVVDGDAVYVAIEGQASDTREPGVFYSHAMFDEDGKIAGWSTWSKVGVPYNPFPSVTNPTQCCCTCGVKFIEPDLKTGSLWVVEGVTGKLVGYSDWNRGTQQNNLPAVLNQLMPCGVYSSLDLHQATRGFFRRTVPNNLTQTPPTGTAANPTKHRYALFGGYGKVMFARTSEVSDNSPPLASSANQVITLKSPQTPTTDFTRPENLLETFLPERAGCVNVLEYARVDDIDQPEDACANAWGAEEEAANYFFAGTPNGLYVFANGDKSGLLSAYSIGSEVIIGKLNEPPFTNGRWFKAPNITGNVVNITTSGHTLYILTSQNAGKPSRRTFILRRVDFAGDVDTMFANPDQYILAQTGQGKFEGVQEFYGIQIISTGDASCPASKEQLALATNDGMYTSHANQSAGFKGIPVANNATQAQWELFDATQGLLFHQIAGTDMPVRHTIWPLSLADRFNCKALDRSNVHQQSGTGFTEECFVSPSEESCLDDFYESCFESCVENAGLFLANNFLPDHFNASGAHAGSCFTPLPFTRFFWQDGARRMFVFSRTPQYGAQDRIGVVPFFPTDWSVQQPTILTHPVFDEVKRIYWIQQFGVTGFLLAGTDRGIIALE